MSETTTPSPTQTDDIAIVGRFGAVHGIKGWLKVYSFTEPFDNLANYGPWFAFIKKQWQPLVVEEIRVTDDHLLVLLKDINDREIARSLTNIEIGVSRQQFPELTADEYYWADLEGLRVINQTGEELGQVYMLLETGSNDVFIVRKDQQEYAIPYLDSVVKAIDLKKRCMYIDWDTDF